MIRTAISAQARHGALIFMPPTDCLDDYLELVTAVEATVEALSTPVIVEGYEPPSDPRLTNFQVTPDPGVIEHPASAPAGTNWSNARRISTKSRIFHA